MKNDVIVSAILVLSLVGIQETRAQSCETTSLKTTDSTAENKGAASGTNSGCTPSACKGAKTKFGEASVISDLRLVLIDLKSKMEKHKTIKFSPRSYDIHGIVGQTDDESLQIIKDEIEVLQKELAQMLGVDFTPMQYPRSKAKQVAFLKARLKQLEESL